MFLISRLVFNFKVACFLHLCCSWLFDQKGVLRSTVSLVKTLLAKSVAVHGKVSKVLVFVSLFFLFPWFLVSLFPLIGYLCVCSLSFFPLSLSFTVSHKTHSRKESLRRLHR